MSFIIILDNGVQSQQCIDCGSVVKELQGMEHKCEPRSCEDCGNITGPFITKSDHHGGLKHVCQDRIVCNTRS